MIFNWKDFFLLSKFIFFLKRRKEIKSSQHSQWKSENVISSVIPKCAHKCVRERKSEWEHKTICCFSLTYLYHAIQHTEQKQILCLYSRTKTNNGIIISRYGDNHITDNRLFSLEQCAREKTIFRALPPTLISLGFFLPYAFHEFSAHIDVEFFHNLLQLYLCRSIESTI